MKFPVHLLAVFLAASAAAQEPASPAAPQPTPPATSEAKDGKKTADAKSTEAALPAGPAAAKGSPQRFEPSERVRPDFDVAFPVDI